MPKLTVGITGLKGPVDGIEDPREMYNFSWTLWFLCLGSSLLKRFKNKKIWERYERQQSITEPRYTIQGLTLSFTFWFLQSLRDKQKAVRENQAPNMKQMKMWSVSKNPVKILVQQLELFWLSKHGSVSVLLM